MKEKILVLAKAYPVISKTYDNLVCVAGITESGELRRIYPVPWKVFWNQKGFKKKQWIECENLGRKSEDTREESRKIDISSIKNLDEASWNTIKDYVTKNLTTYNELKKKVKDTPTSIGFIKPEIIDFVKEKRSDIVLEKIEAKKAQTTLESNFESGEVKHAAKIEEFEENFSYVFTDDSTGEKHQLNCIDWEAGALYRRYTDREVGFQKLKERFLDDFKKKPEIYFMLGTHHRYKTLMIIAVIYPKNSDITK